MNYNVPKVGIIVKAVMTAGTPRAGRVFLAEIARAHSGPERLEEMLNQSEPFIPLSGKGNFSILNKRHLVYLTTSDRGEIDYYRNLITIARREDVRLILRGRKALSGTLLIEMPMGMDRVLDYLNSQRVFLPLLVGKLLALVNCSSIVSLTPTKLISAKKRRT